MEAEELAKQREAISLYERGSEKEAIGLMSDAIRFYSSALRLDHDVEKRYREKLHEEYQASLEESRSVTPVLNDLKKLNLDGTPTTQLNVEDEEEIELQPCWLLEILPDDILTEIIAVLITVDPHAHVNLSTTCQKLSELSFSSHSYKVLSNLIYPTQVYSSVTMQLNDISSDQQKMVQNWDFNWEKMLTDRPFLKYVGVYISKVSYISDGARTSSFYAPVKLVTYFRYLRFYPEGKVLKLTTTDEPGLIVPFFQKENVKKWQNAMVSSFSLEADGQVVIRTQTEQYRFVEELGIVSLGYRKFHRLNWESSYIINKDGDRDYFSLRKEKPFNFSGVKSYKVDF